MRQETGGGAHGGRDPRKIRSYPRGGSISDGDGEEMGREDGAIRFVNLYVPHVSYEGSIIKKNCFKKAPSTP